MKKTGKTNNYTALIYFHGIGKPNRHEEISRLSDGLSEYAMSENPASIGELRNFKTRSESMRGNRNQLISYLSFNRFIKYKNGPRKLPHNYRLYEGFWSHTTAGSMPAWTVMIWFFMHWLRFLLSPFRKWRNSRRLKLISLLKLAETLTTPKEKSYCDQLANHYRHFDKRDARLKFPNGTLKEFLKFLATKFNAVELDFAHRLITQWRQQYRADVKKLLWLYTAAAAAPIIISAVLIAGSVFSYQYTNGVWHFLSQTLVLVFSSLLFNLYKTYVADIFFWVNEQEKSSSFTKKHAILDQSLAILRHVLSDEKCTKVVILAHSLGTSIAFDSLIELGRWRESYTDTNHDMKTTRPCSQALDLSKVSHFITLGSPIDKIASIFEVSRTDFHRYNDFIDYTKGNVTYSPFTINGDQNIEWTNIWDPRDYVSDPLYSKQYSLRQNSEIYNWKIQTANSWNPQKRHVSYLENMKVMEKVFESFILKGN